MAQTFSNFRIERDLAKQKEALQNEGKSTDNIDGALKAVDEWIEKGKSAEINLLKKAFNFEALRAES